MSRRLAFALVFVLVVAACGDDDATTTSSSPTSLVPTTSAPGTTTTEPLATTTVASALFTVEAYGIFPDPLLTPADGHGSGCAPPGDVLPDGIWFGFATSLADTEVAFDLACFFTGDAAVAAATADGEVDYDLDFYIRNQNPKLFSVSLDQFGTAYWVDTTGDDLGPFPAAMPDWPVIAGYIPCPGEFCSVWLFVNDGIATELVEQYLP